MSTPKHTTEAAAPRSLVLGDTILIRLTAADTDGSISLFEQRAAPGGGVPMHVHEREDETFQVLEGSVQFTIATPTGTRDLVATTGDTVWAPRGVPHAWRVVGTAPVRLLFAATPAGVERMFTELGTLPPGPPDFARVAEICGRHGVRFV